MAYGQIGRGLDDLGVYVLGAGDTPGSKVDIPGSRSLAFTVESDSDELEGDNSVIAVVRNPKSLSGSIEIGMISLSGLAAMVGGTAGTTGSTPNAITTLDESSAAPARYFQAIGQAFSQDQNGSAYRVTLKKLLVTSGPDETMSVNEWNTPTLDFEGVAVGGVLLTRAQYETSAALPA
jgi:hypothetical protein